MSRGKVRSATFVTIARGDKPLIAVTTVTVTSPSSSLLGEEDKRRLKAKLRADHPLTMEERLFLDELVKLKKKPGRPRAEQARSLRVAQYLNYLRAARPKDKQDTIDRMVAKTFGCSVRTVRADIAYAKRFDGGAWWRSTEQCPMLPTAWQFQLE